MEFHEVANIFPLMDGSAFDQLVADVKANGLREPIWKHEEKIIDGRNRWRACGAAGAEPRFREWDGKGSLVGFVVSLNLHRRHLSESQRAMVAAKISNLTVGNPKFCANNPIAPIGAIVSVSKEEAAQLLNVSEQSVTRARKVRDFAVPELVAAVERGEVSVAAAGHVSRMPVERQKSIVEAGPKAVVIAAKAAEHGKESLLGEDFDSISPVQRAERLEDIRPALPKREKQSATVPAPQNKHPRAVDVARALLEEIFSMTRKPATQYSSLDLKQKVAELRVAFNDIWPV